MIYEYPSADQPIRQGDIFRSIPHFYVDPEDLIVIQGDRVKPEQNWIKLVENQTLPLTVSCTVESKLGIVITQDCDTARDMYIAFAEIVPYLELTKKTPRQKDPLGWWVDTLTKQGRENQKLFYLPPDPQVGFSDKMAADFQTIIPVRRQFLERNIEKLRIGRLNSEADEHFREHIAQYFRRYPYDEWYPLTKEEFEVYRTRPTREETPPRAWQE